MISKDQFLVCDGEKGTVRVVTLGAADDEAGVHGSSPE